MEKALQERKAVVGNAWRGKWRRKGKKIRPSENHRRKWRLLMETYCPNSGIERLQPKMPTFPLLSISRI